MSFYNGVLNFTNWSGNVILPTMAGLFFALAILYFSKGQSYSRALYSGLLPLMASGLLRALETFASQRSASQNVAKDVQRPCYIQAVEEAYRAVLLGVAPDPALLGKATDRAFRLFVEDILQIAHAQPEPVLSVANAEEADVRSSRPRSAPSSLPSPLKSPGMMWSRS